LLSVSTIHDRSSSNLDGIVGMAGRAMAYREHAHCRSAVVEMGDDRQHQRRAILVALVPAFEVLPCQRKE
jgi:hypothetical protein